MNSNDQTSRSCLIMGMLMISCIACTGCYKRVVGVKGAGAASYSGQIYEPNLKSNEPGVDQYINITTVHERTLSPFQDDGELPYGQEPSGP